MNILSEESKKTPNQIDICEFNKILIAVDYFPFNEDIFNKAISLAQKYQSQLMIFHCVEGEFQGIPDVMNTSSIGVYGGFYSSDLIVLSEKLIEEAKEEMNIWLKSLGEKALAQGVMAECEYEVGEPGYLICQKAQKWGANLIVMGRRGRRGFSEFLLGSVSNFVLHHAHCSVLIIQK